jgi:hypothetical protein
MGFFVVGVSDLVGANEQIEGVIDTFIIQPFHLEIFHLFYPFFLVR